MPAGCRNRQLRSTAPCTAPEPNPNLVTRHAGSKRPMRPTWPSSVVQQECSRILVQVPGHGAHKPQLPNHTKAACLHPTFLSRPIGGGSGQSGLREAAAAQQFTGGYQRVPEDHLGVFRPWCWPHDRIYLCVLEAGVSRSPSTGLMQARSPTQR
jgi:hypothetical protein